MSAYLLLPEEAELLTETRKFGKLVSEHIEQVLADDSRKRQAAPLLMLEGDLDRLDEAICRCTAERVERCGE